MNDRTRLLIFAGILALSVVIFGFLGTRGCFPTIYTPTPEPTPTAEPPGITPGVYPTPQRDEGSPRVTAVPITATTAAWLTTEERLVRDAAWMVIEREKNANHDWSYQYAEIIDIQVERIRKPEWEQLWPDVHFYLTTRVGIYERDYESGHPANRHFRPLYAVCDSRVYGGFDEMWIAPNFNELLAANGIEVTDANRDLVVKAFILTAIVAPYRLLGDVTFSPPSAIDDPGVWPDDEPLTYRIEAWTQVQGLVYVWRFSFHPNGQIAVANGVIVSSMEGAYTPLDRNALGYTVGVVGDFGYTYELNEVQMNSQ